VVRRIGDGLIGRLAQRHVTHLGAGSLVGPPSEPD
jgi:hypothetical protein